jgi:hypothetical protein
MKFLNFCIEVVQGRGGRPNSVEESQIELVVEEGSSEPVGGRGITVCAGDAMNEALEAESSEVVRHLRGRCRSSRGGRRLGAGDHDWEIRREVDEAGKGLQEGHDARVTEAQGGHALARSDGRDWWYSRYSGSSRLASEAPRPSRCVSPRSADRSRE